MFFEPERASDSGEQSIFFVYHCCKLSLGICIGRRIFPPKIFSQKFKKSFEFFVVVAALSRLRSFICRFIFFCFRYYCCILSALKNNKIFRQPFGCRALSFFFLGLFHVFLHETTLYNNASNFLCHSDGRVHKRCRIVHLTIFVPKNDRK